MRTTRATELTESQKKEIILTSELHTIIEMAEYYDVVYITVYNFVRANNLKYKLAKPQKVKVTQTAVVPYSELLKERSAVTPDPPRKWQRPRAEYSNQQYDDLISKILNDGE
jgi:hypothetical protein